MCLLLRGGRPTRRCSAAVVALLVLLVVGSGAALGTESGAGSASPELASIDPELEELRGEHTVVVRFEPGPEGDPEAKRAHANDVREPFERYAETTDGVTVERTFWITNAAAVTIDTDRVDVAELADVDGVTAISADEPVTVPTAASGGSADGFERNGTSTHGLEQLRVEEAWDTYRTRGEGTSVAVLDSGVDDEHPDLDVERWNDFGDDPASEPTAYDDHGTHVSGTVVGGNERGTHIGVAPEAALYHGAVMTDCDDDNCVGYDRNIIAGIEWAVEVKADVIVMSLGKSGYSPALIDAIATANDAGTRVVASVGNQGEDGSTSPGNIYDVTSVGALDESGAIADFSGSEEIETEAAWGRDAPDRWPASYAVPTLAAPGVDVESAVSGGEYETKSGTSMAAPHVAGVAALVQAATAAQLTADDLQTALAEGATATDDAAADRQGHGVVDAVAAIEATGGHGTLEGTATDSVTETPLADAAVVAVADDGSERETTTDDDGEFELPAVDGDRTYDVTVDGDGYEPTTETTHLARSEVATLDLAADGDASIAVTPTDVQFGGDVETATVTATGPAGEYPATRTDDGRFSIENVPSGDEYDLRTVAPGYLEDERSLTVDDPGPSERMVDLRGDATLEVLVETEDGAPVENASVSITDIAGTTVDPDGETDDDGRIDAVVAGTGEQYTVEVDATAFEPVTVESAAVESASTVRLSVPVAGPETASPTVGMLAAALAVLVVGLVRLARR